MKNLKIVLKEKIAIRRLKRKFKKGYRPKIYCISESHNEETFKEVLNQVFKNNNLDLDNQ